MPKYNNDVDGRIYPMKRCPGPANHRKKIPSSHYLLKTYLTYLSGIPLVHQSDVCNPHL